MVKQGITKSKLGGIAIIKHERLLCEALLESLSNRGFYVVGFATNYDEGKLLINTKSPDVIIVGAELGDKFGVDVIAFAQQSRSFTKSIVYARSKRYDLFDRAMLLNVDGYIFVEAGLAELLHCLSEVKEGRSYISPSAFQVSLDSTSSDTIQTKELAALTKREIEIMSFIAQGLTNQEISDKLSRSIATINNHRQNIMKKLNIQGYNQLLRQAILLFGR